MAPSSRAKTGLAELVEVVVVVGSLMNAATKLLTYDTRRYDN